MSNLLVRLFKCVASDHILVNLFDELISPNDGNTQPAAGFSISKGLAIKMAAKCLHQACKQENPCGKYHI